MNHCHLWEHTYLVWTQAGFNQALYHLYGGSKNKDPAYGRATLRESVRGFPKKYPSIVTFDISDMFEGSMIYASCKPAYDVIDKLREHGIDLYPEVKDVPGGKALSGS